MYRVAQIVLLVWLLEYSFVVGVHVDAEEKIMAWVKQYPDRQSTRLPEYDYRRPGYYYVTICTQDQHHAFGAVCDGKMQLSAEGNIGERMWESLVERFPNIRLDAFVFMPNHMHGIIVIKKPPVDVETSRIPERFKPHMKELEESRLVEHPEAYETPTVGWMVRTFKAVATRTIRKNGEPFFEWQKNYWLSIIPNKERLEFIRRYVATNPENWQKDKLYTPK